MKIHDAVTESRHALKNSPTSLLDAEVLLGFVLKKDRSFLIAHPKTKLTPRQRQRFQAMVHERALGKPIAYIRKQKEFFGRTFYVDERVLIPRPETEELVEEALKFLRSRKEIQTIIDLGTGSGNIAITVALELPDRQVLGLDISKDALAVARKNAKLLNCKNVKFVQSNLLTAMPSLFSIPSESKNPFSSASVGMKSKGNRNVVVLANLPYIGTITNHFIAEQTERFEPHIALFGGSDGLELHRRAWKQIKAMNLPIAAMFMEIGFSQAEAVEKEARKIFPAHDIIIKNDLRGLPRIMVVTTPIIHRY